MKDQFEIQVEREMLLWILARRIEDGDNNIYLVNWDNPTEITILCHAEICALEKERK